MAYNVLLDTDSFAVGLPASFVGGWSVPSTSEILLHSESTWAVTLDKTEDGEYAFNIPNGSGGTGAVYSSTAVSA